MKNDILTILREDLNLNVIPCKPSSKLPAIPWKEYQSKKYEGKIYETQNAAIICGQISNLVVIDVDSPEIINKIFDDFDRIKRDTLVVETGSGGYHVYVRPKEGDSYQKKPLTNKQGQHIDIQGDGSYVVAPTSIHPNGKEYRIISSTTNIKEIDLSGFLRGLQSYGFDTEGSGYKSIQDIVKGVTGGDRNNSAFKYTCHLIEKVQMTPDQVWSELLRWNRTNKPPMDDIELERTYKSAVKRSGGFKSKDDEEEPRTDEEWREWLKEHIRKNYIVDELNNKFILNLDYPRLQKMVKRIPASFISTIKSILEEFGLDDAKIELQMEPNIKLNELKTKVGNELICFEGEVIAVEDRQAWAKFANFRCPRCGYMEELVANEFRYIESKRCRNCKHAPILEIVEDDEIQTEFMQTIFVREFIEDSKHSSPVSYRCRIFGDVVGEAIAGQRKRFIGQLRILPKGDGRENRVVIDILDIKNLDSIDVEVATDEEIEEWKELVKNNDFLEHVATNEFAPDVLGYVDMKKLILLSLTGAPKTRYRINNIHLLLLGDSGTAKTTLIERADEICPKSIITSGKGNSAAGLTGGMDRPIPNAPLVFLPGVVTLAHKGVAFIDEIDKMKSEDRDSVLTCMAKGYVPIHKVGIHSKLPADTVIIGSANAKGGRAWNHEMGITKQTNLTVPLLSRFDVITLFTDIVDEYKDKKLSQHVVKQLNKSGEMVQDSMKLMRYINYIKTINPELTKEAQDKIVDFYVKLRKIYATNSEKTGPIDPRTNETIAKLALANARFHMRKDANEKDVEVAIDLIRKALKTFDVDLDEGYTQGSITHDQTKIKREDNIMVVLDSFRNSPSFEKGEFIERMVKQLDCNYAAAEKIFSKYRSLGEIMEAENNKYRI